MVITGAEKCYFLVYTLYGFYLEGILFDGDYCRYLKSLFVRFYTEIYLPNV